MGRMVVADHWNKGPHHFWYEVSTNLMVRQYQTEAALTIQTNWTIGEPDASLFDVAPACSGIRKMNLSCVSPPPGPATEFPAWNGEDEFRALFGRTRHMILVYNGGCPLSAIHLWFM